jgi:predicted amidophosphoribosyltransferase
VLLDYAGPARRLVSGLKYRGNRSALDWLAERLGELVGEPPDVVTWVPTGARRARRRGFDQAEVLAAAVARRLGLDAVRLLARDPRAGPQTGRSREERLAGPGFVATGAVGGTVLLVDDVVTTGASMGGAAGALVAGGAARALALAAAHPRADRPAPRGATALPGGGFGLLR